MKKIFLGCVLAVLATPAMASINLATATQTQVEMNLPVASTLTSADDISGVAGCGSNQQSAALIADVTNQKPDIFYISTTTTGVLMAYTYTYEVK
jgi:hypothetical protein